jgi:DNA repair ATPase RecN
MLFENWRLKHRLIRSYEWDAFRKEIQAAHDEALIPDVQRLVDNTRTLIGEIEKETEPIKNSHRREDRDKLKELEERRATVERSLKDYEITIPTIRRNVQQLRQEVARIRVQIAFIKRWKSKQ